MKRANIHIIILLLLLVTPLTAQGNIHYPVTIWFFDGTIKQNIPKIIIDSNSYTILYFDRNKYKTAFWDEVFAITSEQDTLIITPLAEIPCTEVNYLNTKETFELLSGIHDGFYAKHYKTFFTSLTISYLSNLAFAGENVVIRNIPNLITFYYNACTKIKSSKCKNMYEFGFQIGLQKRKVLETAFGIVAGIYLELVTENTLISN